MTKEDELLVNARIASRILAMAREGRLERKDKTPGELEISVRRAKLELDHAAELVRQTWKVIK